MQSIKSYISRIRRSKDGKVLVSNFAYLSLLQIIGYIFPLITLPYVSRVVGVAGIGKIAFASAVIMWFHTVVDWGFNYTATRDVARCRDDKEMVSKIFSNVLWAKVILMLISFVVLLLCIAVIPIFREHALVLLVTYLMIPGYICFPDWFFQALEKMQYITWLNFVIKLFFTIAIFIFIKQAEDYYYQPLFISLGFILSGMIAMYIIVICWKYTIHKPHWSTVLKTIKSSTDVFINNIAPNLYNSLSVVLLGAWHGDIATGIYNAGKNFLTVCYKLLGMIPRVFFPFIARRIDKHSLFARLYIGISAIGTIGLFAFAPLIIKIFYGPGFEESVTILRMVSISLVLLAIESVYGTNYLLQVGEERLLRNITLVSSIIAFLAALPLIYFLDYTGVAIVYLFANSMLAGLSWYYAKRHQKNNNITQQRL